MNRVARCLYAVAVALVLTSTIALAQTPAIVRVHGHVLSLPSPGTVIASVDEVPGSPAQTRRFHTSDTHVKAGEEFRASLDTTTMTLANIEEIPPLATPPPAHLVTNGSSQSVVLDSFVFILGVLILGGLLAWITKRVIIDERH
jgi:hypothetical protein